jgi:hypothetical protein
VVLTGSIIAGRGNHLSDIDLFAPGETIERIKAGFHMDFMPSVVLMVSIVDHLVAREDSVGHLERGRTDTAARPTLCRRDAGALDAVFPGPHRNSGAVPAGHASGGV